MKITVSIAAVVICALASLSAAGQTQKTSNNDKKLFIDVHHLEPGKVTFNDVTAAHLKDLSVQKQYDVRFLKYWVDEEKGTVYCLSSASDTNVVRQTHAEAHGLLPAYTYVVTDGPEVPVSGKKQLFLDIHRFGPGNVTAAAVADAHKKDLAVQKKNGASFINYWVDEKAGVVLCLSEAANADAVINTHKEAHGLIPVEVRAVKQGE